MKNKNVFKTAVCLFAFAILVSCSGGSQAQKDAQEVCDCLTKTKDQSYKEKSACLALQRKAGEKYLKSPEELQEFNEVLIPCLQETFNSQ